MENLTRAHALMQMMPQASELEGSDPVEISVQFLRANAQAMVNEMVAATREGSDLRRDWIFCWERWAAKLIFLAHFRKCGMEYYVHVLMNVF